MAETPKTNIPNAADFVPNMDESVARVRDMNEKIVEAAKKHGQVTLDMYEKTLADILKFQQEAADSSQVDFISSVTKAYSEYMSAMTKAWTAVARDALK